MPLNHKPSVCCGQTNHFTNIENITLEVSMKHSNYKYTHYAVSMLLGGLSKVPSLAFVAP